jgi:hypothetical protein
VGVQLAEEGAECSPHASMVERPRPRWG